MSYSTHFTGQLVYSQVIKLGLMVKCTPERGHNALFFIPLQVFIVLLWKIIVKKVPEMRFS